MLLALAALAGSLAIAGPAMAKMPMAGKHLGKIQSSARPVLAMAGNGQPVVMGSITAINGNSLTISNASNATFTVDASNAKIWIKNRALTLSNLAIGNTIVVQGTFNGSNVTASSIMNPRAPAQNQNDASKNEKGMFGGMGNFFAHLFGF